MSDPDANDQAMLSRNYTLQHNASPREVRWIPINASQSIYGKLKRTFCA